jgi:hypothetical protein
VDDRTHFRQSWNDLDRRRRWEIRSFAWLGRAAPDLKSANLVVGLVRSRRWGRDIVRELLLAGSVGLSAVAALTWIGSAWFESLVVVVFAIALIKAGLAITGRRALRLNQAVLPPAGVD